MRDFDQLGEHIAREQDQLLIKHNAQAEVRARIAELDVSDLRRSARHSATRRAGLVWAGGGVALAAAAVALIALRGVDTQPKTLAVELADRHVNVAVGQYVQAPRETEVGLRFSDGSHIEVAKSSRARLTGLRSNGADVSLESGQMHVQVKHRDNTSWHIGAGPFGVHVIGTRFDVRWQPEDDSFELTLHEGKVELSGCAFGAGYRMLARQTVRTSCKTGRYDVTSAEGVSMPDAGSGSVESFAHKEHGEHDGEAAQPKPQNAQDAQDVSESPALPVPDEAPHAAAAPQPAQPTSVRPPQPQADKRTVGAAAKSTEQPAKPADWRALVRARRYVQALRAVRAAGLEQECATASSHELRLLAQAARYAQDVDSEAYAWRLLRERFRGTKDGSIAAFALGRIEFDNHGAYAKAAEWFRTYLKEQPSGDLARETLGRLLEAAQNVGDEAATREIAERYLSDYPKGPHAAIARRVSDEKTASTETTGEAR